MNKSSLKKAAKQFVSMTAGCAVFAVAFTLFLEPMRIAPGGVSGLSVVINYLTGFPLGMTIIALNIPLFILAWRKFGLRFIGRTIYATVLSSVMIDLAAGLLPPITEDVLLAALYGGLLLGLGLGLVFAGGGTTGGSDIMIKLLRLRFPNIKLGRLLMLVDTVIIGLSALVFKDINRALYAAIALYVNTLVFDSVVYRFDFAALTCIISNQPDTVGQAITEQLDRGITYLSGRGGYTGTEKQVILCATKRSELPALYHVVEEADPAAFLIAMDVHQVFGEGFAKRA